MATTTNYGWTTPNDTDLVKDGAAAIRTLGSSVDTTTKNLNPETTTGDLAYRSATANVKTRLGIGTTGQVLTVAGGVPSWATPTTGDIEGVTAGTGISGGGTSGTVTITNSMATEITAKGDLIVGTGNAAFDNLAVGTNGHVLTADSTVSPTGLKWAAPAAGSSTFVGAVVYNSTTQSISNATYTTLLFDTESLDTNTFHDTSTNKGRFTIPSGKNGVYSINIYFAQGTSLTGDRVIRWLKNGTTYNYTRAKQNLDSETMRAALTISLVATDYIEAQYYQNAGSSQTVDVTIDYCQYSITYLGA